MLTPKAVAALMLERIRHHVRLPQPPTEASTESMREGSKEGMLEGAPPDSSRAAPPRASSQSEL